MKIEIKDLVFSYDQKRILDDINININSGEVVCILGPNGSGKTTLMKCMEKLLEPQAGTILFDSFDSSQMSHKDIASIVGYVPQSTAQVFSASVFDCVLLGLNSGWDVSNEDIDQVTEILIQLDLEDLAMRDYNALSGGQQQRVLIGRALAQTPQILLLDEPTSALDIAHQLDLMELIQALARIHEITVVMIVHDLNLAARYADKVVLLKDSKVYSSGKPEDVFTHAAIRDVYGVDCSIQNQDANLLITPIQCCTQKGYDSLLKSFIEV